MDSWRRFSRTSDVYKLIRAYANLTERLPFPDSKKSIHLAYARPVQGSPDCRHAAVCARQGQPSAAHSAEEINVKIMKLNGAIRIEIVAQKARFELNGVRRTTPVLSSFARIVVPGTNWLQISHEYVQ